MIEYVHARPKPIPTIVRTIQATHTHLLWQLWIWQRYDSELRQHQERITLLILHLLYSSIETTLHPNSQTSRLLNYSVGLHPPQKLGLGAGRCLILAMYFNSVLILADLFRFPDE